MAIQEQDFLGEITTPLLGFGNLINLFWTIGLISEELRNGPGSGSSLEMGALVMWLTQLFCLPLLLLGFIYLIVRFKRKYWKWNLLLFISLFAQMVLCNLLLVY